MKLLMIVTSLIAIGICGVVPSESGAECIVDLSDINYYFYNIQNPENPIKVPSTNPAAINNTHFNKLKKTIILVHGAGGNTTGLLNSVRNAVFNAKIDINLILLNWSPIIDGCPYTFLSVLPQCAQWVADFLKVMTQSYGLKYSDLTITGHSAAGWLLGKIGEATKGQINQMDVLDSSNVDKNHAKFVQYITTTYASKEVVLGHSTYYPNGGINQPGCSNWKCSHWRVVELYAESLVSKKFVSKKCDSYADYTAGQCENNTSGILGGIQLDIGAQGIFFLNTNDKPPYAKG